MVREDISQLLLASVDVLHILISVSPFEKTLDQALAALGKSTGVDQASVLALNMDLKAKSAQVERRAYWTRKTGSSTQEPDGQNAFPYDIDRAEFYRVLIKGEAFVGVLKPAPDLAPMGAVRKVRSVAVLPILFDEQLWGMICLEDQDATRKWSPETIQLLLTVANGFSGAIRRGKLEQNESEQRILAEALRETANALNQSLRLSDVLESILSNIGSVVPHDSANIMLVSNGRAHVTACHGYEKLGGDERVLKQVRVINDVPNLKRMVETGLPIVVPDTHDSQEWVQFATSAWIHSYVSAPICRNGKTIGFLNINSGTPGFYSNVHAQRLLTFANQAAVAIENSRLFESARKEIAVRKRAEDALQEAKNNLETQVELRTQELRLANENLRLELVRRQQAEALLEKERALLAQRVEERTAELSAANSELARAAQLKDAFLASMSHELRTPLNAILNISETLQECVYGDLNEAQVRSVSMIEESGRHLLSLINDILDLSKIGAGRFDLLWDRSSVKSVCEASLALVEEAARKKGLIVTFSMDSSVNSIWADQRRLKQVLVNLLSNAVKFTPVGGTVGLSVVGEPEKERVRFIVSDSGIGIPEEKMKYLFQPFVQLDHGLSRQFEGTGLGLALAYRIIDLHGGGITVNSQPGMGSQFTVTMHWSEEKNVQGRPRISSLEENANESAQEQGSMDPLMLIRMYMNEMGIEMQSAWVTPDIPLEPGKLVSDYDILIVDPLHLNLRTDLSQLFAQLGEYQSWPIILLGDAPGTESQTLPENIGRLPANFDRQQLRSLIKRISPNGTASLIRRAMVLREKPPSKTEDQPEILLVDDNDTSRKVFCDYLIARGYRVSEACNGLQALEQAIANLPDLIVMDIQMPGMNGIEAIRQIRADVQLRTIPVLALTALAMPGDKAMCLEAGANEYLSRPISLSSFLEAIEKHLQPVMTPISEQEHG